MHERFLTFLNTLIPEQGTQRILLAVSGGVDSVVMAHLCACSNHFLGIAHCNYGLRGAESNDDENFVHELAARNSWPFYVLRPDVAEEKARTGLSIQMAARKVRYAWFESLRVQHHYNFIATAHHGGDHVETILLNLTRGAGPEGLLGIPKSRDHLVRPMLFANRDEIETFANENNLSWRHDRSNDTDYYQRNRIRRYVVPVLRELNPSIEAAFFQSTERAASAERILLHWFNAWEKSNVRQIDGGIRVSINALLAAPDPIFTLERLLRPLGFSYAAVTNVAKILGAGTGKIITTADHIVLKDREDLVISEKAKDNADVPNIIVERLPQKKLDFKSLAHNQAALDAGKINWPIHIRSWKNEDKFCPLGMNGQHKLVSDLLIDLKVNRLKKIKVWVVLDANATIIWVVGHRVDDRFKIDGGTKEIALLMVGDL